MKDERYSFGEAVADLAYNAGHYCCRIDENSRAMMAEIIGWAEEFEKRHSKTEWGVDIDYIDTIDNFFFEKIVEHFDRLEFICPECGDSCLRKKANIWRREDEKTECKTCWAIYQAVKPALFEKLLKEFEIPRPKELYDDEAKAMLGFLTCKHDGHFKGILEDNENYKCCGVYRDESVYVAFDNTGGECFVEEFHKRSTAIMWIRGLIEIEDKNRYE